MHAGRGPYPKPLSGVETAFSQESCHARKRRLGHHNPVADHGAAGLIHYFDFTHRLKLLGVGTGVSYACCFLR